jgi:hypothetical protein
MMHNITEGGELDLDCKIIDFDEEKTIPQKPPETWR